VNVVYLMLLRSNRRERIWIPSMRRIGVFLVLRAASLSDD
jgi:hypothetical protein